MVATNTQQSSTGSIIPIQPGEVGSHNAVAEGDPTVGNQNQLPSRSRGPSVSMGQPPSPDTLASGRDSGQAAAMHVEYLGPVSIVLDVTFIAR